MSFFSILYNIIILPIEFVIEWIFNFYNIKIAVFGIAGAILAVSIGVNFLALPLYAIADSLQEKERKTQLKLEKWVKHIRKNFKGDERFMLLQAYYRENNYHPLYALRSSLSILIEIPFFIAAYHFLSHSTALQGASFAFLSDLGAADSLISFTLGSHNIVINVLPVLMTLINFVSGAIYLKNAPLKEKVQLYALALVFLVILYNSPSGLVCYWILNNLFSLVKNIVMQQKHPKKILHIIICFLLAALSALFLIKKGAFIKKIIAVVFTAIIILLPKITAFLKQKFTASPLFNETEADKSSFLITFTGGLGTALLAGFLLPSIIISSSPLEFAYLGETASPLSYILSSFLVFFGFFVFWPCAIYLMFGNKVKKSLPVLSFLVLVMALLNAFIFKYDYGIIDVIFNVEIKTALKVYTPFYTILPICAFIAVCVLWKFLSVKKHLNIAVILCLIVCIAEIPMGIMKTNKISNIYSEFKKNKENEVTQSSDEIQKVIHLSKTKKNVIVLFMDRAIGCYLPYFLDQFPQYKSSFDGFINYENTLSFGAHTITGAPPMFGGYEYTPEEMAKRSDELLVNKHNEATILLPTLFGEKGWHSSIIDPPWSNYKGFSEKDFSEFDGLSNVDVNSVIGVYSTKYEKEHEGINEVIPTDTICRHEIINFNVLQILPPLVRNTFYNDFRYELPNIQAFIDHFSGLYYINEETDFSSDSDNYVFYTNETIHRLTYLNEDFDYPLTYRRNNNTGSYKTKDDFETQLYEVYCATFKKVAEYFDYLRKNNAYDNSRIIIVSDHGYYANMTHYKNFTPKTVDYTYDYTEGDRIIPNRFDCTLMFKDFNCNDPIKTDSTFMTNADCFFLAKQDLNISDTNPFTKKKFKQNKEDGINLFFQDSSELNAQNMINRTGITFDEDSAWHFNPGAINDPKNWVPYKKWKASNISNPSISNQE